MVKKGQSVILKRRNQQGRVPLIYIMILLIIILAIVIAGFVSSNFFSDLIADQDSSTTVKTVPIPATPSNATPNGQSVPSGQTADQTGTAETLDPDFDEQLVEQPEKTGAPSKVSEPVTLATIDDLGSTDTPPNAEVIQERARELYNDEPSADLISQWVLTDNLVSRFVTVINGIADHDIVYRQMVVPTPRSNFIAKETSAGLAISENNYARYVTYIDMIASLKTSTLVATYKVYLPRFEEEFSLLGYGNITFASRTRQALQVLLDTNPIEQTNYYLKPQDAYGRYEFLDEGNEAQDPIQKLYVRMGKANEMRLKRKVADILTALNQ
ncbi:DUF3014 domain-containing protein [Gynuella sp.]|uniref:DUF3014 domain-containing protein n=1 Tax=Gynuella sp. TaxID=2969146 RepID=UPI003D0F4DDE